MAVGHAWPCNGLPAMFQPFPGMDAKGRVLQRKTRPFVLCFALYCIVICGLL